MSGIEYEGWNITPPLKNSNAMKCIATISVSATPSATDLTALFGSLGNGHYLTLQPDGVKMYIAFAANSSDGSPIDETARGTGKAACFPLTADVPFPIRPVGGREVATAIATLCTYNFLHAKVASGVATSTLFVYRSSAASNQGSEQFPAP
jgi:hypothetical protein